MRKTLLEELASYTLMSRGLAIDKEVDYGTRHSQPSAGDKIILNHSGNSDGFAFQQGW